MKKLIIFAMTMLLLMSFFGAAAFAETNSTSVYVTISDGKGDLVVTRASITVTDIDNDGSLTINDALYAAHEAKFTGGAAVGYATATGDYGLSITKLWGVENGGSFGYYVNNASAISLTDAIKNGDSINAFAYSDLTAWSDTYSYFDVSTVAAKAGQAFTLTLSAAGFDVSWNPVVSPVEGAVIEIDGIATDIKTDAKGKATITIDNEGTFVISASSASKVLVPSICVAAIGNINPQTSDNLNMIMYIAISTVALAGAAVIILCHKNTYEK